MKNKGKMARRLVLYCITVLSLTTVWALIVKTIGVCTSNTVDLTDILTFVGAVFGGELLMLLMKRIFTKNESTEKRKEEYIYEDSVG